VQEESKVTLGSDLVTKRPDRVRQFSQTQLQARFHRAKRSMSRSGNFAVTQSLEESEFDRLALKPRQRSHAFLEKVMQIVQDKRIVRFTTQIPRLLHQSFSITFPCTRIGLAPAQSVNGAAPGDRHHPAQRPASLRRVLIGFLPNLNEDFL
jgi:hypothetical protein